MSTATIVVGTAGGLRSVDGAALSDVDVTALAHQAGGWLVLSGEHNVVRIHDGAEQASSITGPTGRCLIADDADVLIGTAEAHLLRLSAGSIEPVASFDAADGRNDWYTPWGGPPDTRSLARGVEGNTYANIHVGGILRSANGGASWEPTLDIDDDVHQVIADPERPGRVLAAAAVGLIESNDGGDTWAYVTEGLRSTYARAVAVAGDAILLTASDGPRGGHGAVYRRPSDGGAFERCTSGLPEWFESNIDTHRLAASGETAAFGTDDGRVFVSQDAGSTWELVEDQLPPIRAVAVTA